MAERARIAVIGLYNSGSLAIAGMLHRLGVNMGQPFWCTISGKTEINHYEPYDLAWHLRTWWNEPAGIERVPAVQRIRFLERWAAAQECVQPGPVGSSIRFCRRAARISWPRGEAKPVLSGPGDR